MASREWTEIALPLLISLPGKLHLRAQNMMSGDVFPLHDHPWHQLVYATEGTLMIRLEPAWHVVTPEQAVWIPAGVRHATAALTNAAFRTLYISEDAVDMPRQVGVLAASALLHALIRELDGLSEHDLSSEYAASLRQTILRHLERRPPEDVSLPWPSLPALRGLCEALYNNPGDARSVAELAHDYGMSERTLMRRCHACLGMSLNLWRQRMRVFRALEWLGQNRPVTEVALELGYNSPSAFGHMFRAAMGVSPSEWKTMKLGGAFG